MNAVMYSKYRMQGRIDYKAILMIRSTLLASQFRHTCYILLCYTLETGFKVTICPRGNLLNFICRFAK